MKPNFLNRFMKKLTRERVAPTISASGVKSWSASSSSSREPFCSVFQVEISESIDSSSGGDLSAKPDDWSPSLSDRWRNRMLRTDLLKPDLVSEVVLLGSGALLVVSLLLIVVTALARA